MFRGKTFYIKRDDLIDPYLSGNKYRKLYALTQLSPTDIDTLISYGGNQSNAMFSIAALCHQKGWNFKYVTKTIPDYLRNNLIGNLKNALDMGMKLHEVPAMEYEETIDVLKKDHPLTNSEPRTSNPELQTIFIRQGGADPLAEEGIVVLAQEIEQWSKKGNVNTLNIITPSGTGTTAFYLAKSLPQFQVYTTALVGTTLYLKDQMSQLGGIPENLHIMETKKMYRFGHLYKEYLQMYDALRDAGMTFDLLYAPKTWLALEENSEKIEGDILYVHSGGIRGNETMLERYRYKNMHL